MPDAEGIYAEGEVIAKCQENIVFFQGLADALAEFGQNSMAQEFAECQKIVKAASRLQVMFSCPENVPAPAPKEVSDNYEDFMWRNDQ